MTPIISHLYQNSISGEWVIQTNDEHSRGVADLAARFADDFGMGMFGEILGYLHDRGKATPAFQAHIKRNSGMDPSARAAGNPHHAYIGGLVATKLYQRYALLLSNCIMGHHRGLYDLDEVKEMVKEQLPEGIDMDEVHTTYSTPEFKVPRESLHHIIRMLFSCLVDADYLDTERFMDGDKSRKRQGGKGLDELLPILENHLERLRKTAPDTPVNRVRTTVQDYARKNSDCANGLYEMTVPTGGGKTLSSLLWALSHAVRNGLKRIIIAIPYTSIIEQTAQTLKGIFGEENVLEHHSQVADSTPDREMRTRYELATENWDYPIVVTTNVRLFETMFNNRPSKCRRLHNLAKSVIILDEVQTLPLDLYQPIVNGLKSLYTVFGCSVLFTTASQPVLTGILRGTNKLQQFKGFVSPPKAIVPHDETLWQPLRRARIISDATRHSCEEIAAKMSAASRVLCIVNTRQIAQEIYGWLPVADTTIHLSRMMCPAHLKERLDYMKHLLENPRNEVRVISTQLIEAGVDVDFPLVLRQEAGLDSIIQAAGRCNREGLMEEKGETYVFELDRVGSVPKGFLAKANQVRKRVCANLEEEEWFADSTMSQFFEELIGTVDCFDKYDTEKDLTKYLKFETASKNFKYIDNADYPVIVNWGKSMKLVDQFKQHGPSYELNKELCQYSVNVSRYNFSRLINQGLIEEVGGLYVIRCTKAYSPEVGLIIDNEWLEEPMVI
jgi:CRISPR-associated endonuclease/helicase Cas3